MTESDPVKPSSYYGETKLHAEQLIQQADIDWRIARLATVFGPGDMANFWRLAQAIRHRAFVIPGCGDQRKSCIDVDTVAHVLVGMCLHPQLARSIVNVAFAEAPRLLDIATAFSRLLGAPTPPRIPTPLLWSAAACGTAISSLGLPTPLTIGDLRKLCAWTWVDVSRALSAMPEIGRRSFASAIDASADHYSQT